MSEKNHGKKTNGDHWYPFGRGVPTEADIKRLNDAFPNLKVGDIVTHSQIEGVIHEKYGSNRYRTVTHRWRKKLEQNNTNSLLLIPDSDAKGYRVANPSERVAKVGSEQKHKLRGIVRWSGVALRTDPEQLTDQERRARDYQTRIGSVLKLAAVTEARKHKSEERQLNGNQHSNPQN